MVIFFSNYVAFSEYQNFSQSLSSLIQLISNLLTFLHSAICFQNTIIQIPKQHFNTTKCSISCHILISRFGNHCGKGSQRWQCHSVGSCSSCTKTFVLGSKSPNRRPHQFGHSARSGTKTIKSIYFFGVYTTCFLI